MKQILRFIVLVILIGGALVGLDHLALSGDFPALQRAREWLFALPYVGGILFRDPMTFSRWLTLILVVLGAGYLVVHLVELLFRAIAALFGKSHAGLATKHHARRFFLSAMIVKGVLVIVQLGLLVTQAYSLSKFLHGVIDDPQTFYDIVRTDIVFIALLAVLLFVQFVRPRSHNPPSGQF